MFQLPVLGLSRVEIAFSTSAILPVAVAVLERGLSFLHKLPGVAISSVLHLTKVDNWRLVPNID